jgi:restriction system protein
MPRYYHVHLTTVLPHGHAYFIGVSFGDLWAVSTTVQSGDIVISSDGRGRYRVGEVRGDYDYAPGFVLARPVRWHDVRIARDDMSASLRYSVVDGETVSDVTRYARELERLIGGVSEPTVPSTDQPVADTAPEALHDAPEAIDDTVTRCAAESGTLVDVAPPCSSTDQPVESAAFALEAHLEDFLVKHWEQTDLGAAYDLMARQLQTDTGPMDILAVSKDKKRLLVVELKKGRASDAVVGQTLRYMGYAQEVVAVQGQTVSGLIIALDDDQRIRRALALVPSITFMRYQLDFKLVKA